MPRVPVIKEIWPLPPKEGSRPVIIGPVAAGDGNDEARKIALNMVALFAHNGYNDEYDYAWGYNDGASEFCRCVRGDRHGGVPADGAVPRVPVIKEIWPLPLKDGNPPVIVGPVAAVDGYDQAREVARNIVALFAHHGYNDEYDYAWGYNDGAAEFCRYVVGRRGRRR